WQRERLSLFLEMIREGRCVCMSVCVCVWVCVWVCVRVGVCVQTIATTILNAAEVQCVFFSNIVHKCVRGILLAARQYASLVSVCVCVCVCVRVCALLMQCASNEHTDVCWCFCLWPAASGCWPGVMITPQIARAHV